MRIKKIVLSIIFSCIFLGLALGQARSVNIEYFTSNNLKIYTIDENCNMWGLGYEKIYRNFFYEFELSILEPKSIRLNNKCELDYGYSIKSGFGYIINHGKRLQFPYSFLFGWMKFKTNNVPLSSFTISFVPRLRFYITNSFALSIGYNLEGFGIYKAGNTALEKTAHGNLYGPYLSLTFSFEK